MEDVPEPPVNPNFDDFDDYEEDQTSDLHDDDDDDEDQTSDLHADDERKIMNFMKDLPSRVTFRRPESKYHLWSFWSERTLSLCSGGSITDSATHTPTTNQPIISDIIKSVLLDFHHNFYEKVLIQFWTEIKEGLKVVCKTHNLPLAKTWIPCGHFNGLAFSYDTFDESCIGPAFHCDLEASYLLHHNMEEFFYDWNDFQNGQEVVRSAYQSHKLCFCRDLTQFSITEYPSLPLARAFGLTGCFAIYLQSTRAKNYHYVLEFFLNPKNTYGEDPSTFLCPIFEIMKQHVPSFKLASGEELRKELPIEVTKPRMNQEETASFQCQSTLSPSRPGVLHNAQEMMQPHSSNQQMLVQVEDINNEWNLVNDEQNKIPVSCSNEAINSITYEELKKHFGKKLEDVAQNFDVSRSTFKRICRKNGIHRWKRGKRNKVEGSPSRRDPPCSHSPAEKLVATVAT